jgi:endonuclease/exonuclease/phosphatase (EEP) superfamily protein YafD
VALWAACDDAPPAECDGGSEAVPVTAMQYNLAGHDTLEANQWKGENIAAHITDTAPDFVTAQECSDCDWLLAQLPARYELTAEPRAGVTIMFDADTWLIEDDGVFILGNNDDGWGERPASWALFSHLEIDYRLYVYSTHWCMLVRSDTDDCTDQRQVEYADMILEHIAQQDCQAPVILGGDLNVFEGFDQSRPVARLIDAGFVDLFRVLHPDDEVITYQGNSWSPPGRVDFIFGIAPVTVLSAIVDDETLSFDEGSDHYAVIAEVQFGDAPSRLCAGDL